MDITKNKLLLFVVFLATVAVLFYRLGYDKRATDLSTQNQSDKTTIGNKIATIGAIIDKLPDKSIINSSLLTKSQQTENSDSKGSAKIPQVDAKESVPVLRVIDGDTIVAKVNGQPIHIRLIGIDSPELNDGRPQVACLAQKAKEEAEKLLNGQKVYLEKDSTQGDYDKYNRLLAYVFLPTDSTSLPSTQFGTGTTSSTNFNKLMIEEGYAYEYTYYLPYKYQSEFRDAQNKARAVKKGLWSSNICSN